jgi:hypothetical protein
VNLPAGGKSALMSLDHPKQAGCKGCSGDSGPGLNTGLVLVKNTPTGGVNPPPLIINPPVSQ